MIVQVQCRRWDWSLHCKMLMLSSPRFSLHFVRVFYDYNVLCGFYVCFSICEKSK